MSRGRSTTRFGRGHQAMALVPLALLSAAWTASVAGSGASTALASSPERTLPDGSTVPTEAIRAPASVSDAGRVAPGVTGSARRAVSTASVSGIPAAALAAYQRAEAVINAADKTCNLTWQLVAAVGRVESDHGRSGGNSLDAQGIARPGIFGIPLDGRRGTSRVSDTDAGQYDADTRFDRAIGPMQFIPSTWSVVGVDADGDGKRDPQDVDDAALATAVYLCSGGDDLSAVTGQRAAVYRYNHSTSYVDLVLSIMNAYLDGEFTSVPNGTTSAGYVVPEPPAMQPGGPGKGDGQQTGQQGGGSGDTPAQPDPAPEPSAGPTEPAGPQQPGGGSGSGGGGGGGILGLPAPTLPPLPSTSVEPVDKLLSHAQAVVQCTLDGYIDNLLRSDDPFDKCVYDYTHR